MAKTILPLFLFFLFLAAGTTPAHALQELTVLVYHEIDPEASSDVSCTPGQFADQMKAVLQNGNHPLSLPEARLFLMGALPEVQRPVLITFDDGYESVFTHAFPLATQLRIPMTVFVVSSRIGLKPQFIPYLTRDQIRRMSDSGFFWFGSHTHDLHVNSLAIFQAFQTRPNPFLTQLHSDLVQSRDELAHISGRPVSALAWPYGKFNWDMTDIARQCGYTMHFTSQYGYNEPGSNPLGIKRIPVTARDTPESVLRKLRN